MKLDNVESLNTAHPDTFEIPSRADRAALRPGDFAKVILTNGKAGERFWVIVKETSGGRYVGAVNNHLTLFNLPVRYLITFGPEHIADIRRSPETPKPAGSAS